MEIFDKLKFLDNSAKYNVSYSSNGSNRKNLNNGIENGHVSGICHSWGGRLYMYLSFKNPFYERLYV